MNVALVSTIFHQPHIAPYHGVTAPSYPEVMDVDTDGHRLTHRNSDIDLMDTTLDGARDVTQKDKAPEQPVQHAQLTAKDVVTAAAEEPTQVLERPREGGDDEAAESSKQMPIIPQPQLLPLTSNLISLYGLQPLAASVARFDPITGEKINKMRKSYEGQLKTLGLSGRNRAVKHDEGKGMGLNQMLSWPEEEWQNQKVGSKDVRNGLPGDILAKLDKAMQMQPGPVPNNNEWEDQLGHEKIKSVEQITKAAKVPQKTIAKKEIQANGSPADVEAIRPKRSGRKRRYDEHSFEGYGEGYVDDEIDLGYSSGDTQFSRRSSSNKKRKKDHGNVSTNFRDRPGSFSSNRVGVSAYGR